MNASVWKQCSYTSSIGTFSFKAKNTWLLTKHLNQHLLYDELCCEIHWPLYSESLRHDASVPLLYEYCDNPSSLTNTKAALRNPPPYKSCFVAWMSNQHSISELFWARGFVQSTLDLSMSCSLSSHMPLGAICHWTTLENWTGGSCTHLLMSVFNYLCE